MKLTQNEGRGRAEDRHALRRQAGQGSLRPEPDLLEIRKLTNELPAIPGRMGAGALTDSALEKAEKAQVPIVVDPDVVALAETYSWMFKDEAESDPAVQVACGRLTSRLGKWRGVRSGLFAAQQLDRDLGDTDRWAGKEEQGMQAEFFRVLDGMLDGTIGNLAPAEVANISALRWLIEPTPGEPKVIDPALAFEARTRSASVLCGDSAAMPKTTGAVARAVIGS